MQEYKIQFSEAIYDYNYEDLIKNPNYMIKQIINWLDWDWDENIFRHTKIKEMYLLLVALK